ncbi:MAG: 4Fe-4S dicluster domain-containing protein [Eggerthellaceae bacterium]|nr:4Fe-4S dicluster domain-containing protein [Eggerthellaceae bacterium]
MNTETMSERSSLSRRGFLSGAGLLAAGTAALAVAKAPAVAEAAEAEPTDTSQAGVIFKGVTLSKGRILHNPDICSGCRTCELVCSTYHDGVAAPSLSRLFVKKDVQDACTTNILACKQCAGAECVAVCPSGALHVDKDTGARVIDETLCVGCQLCLHACPCEPPRIRYNAAKGVCFKCDLCGGEPQCVKFCPMGALQASWDFVDINNLEDSFYTIDLTGDTKTFAHVETSSLALEDSDAGAKLTGVVWTSHATQFNIILCCFTITADFFDAAGNLIGSSDGEAYVDIPEMNSGPWTLTCAGIDDVSKIGSVTIHVYGEAITNTPED